MTTSTATISALLPPMTGPFPPFSWGDDALRLVDTAAQSVLSSCEPKQRSKMGGEDLELWRCALAGEGAAVRALVKRLTPTIQARVARRLAARGRRAGKDMREELADIMQEVFVTLFENDARTLRAWRPDGGLSLLNFVGLVAEREASSILRSGRRCGWREDAAAPEDFESRAADHDLESQMADRESLRLLLDQLHEQLSPLGTQLFQLMMIDGLDTDEVCQRMEMTRTAVYAWRSRLADHARVIGARLAAERTTQAQRAANQQGGAS